MKVLSIAICVAAMLLVRASSAEQSMRFAPLSADQLTPEQKKWADSITAPPRNGKFVNPPYRAYIRSPELAAHLTAVSDYVRWHSSLPPRISSASSATTTWSQ